MPPILGTIHRRPRSDSGAVRLWEWALIQRGPWTTLDAAEAAGITLRRARAIVVAMGEAGLLDCTREPERVSGLQTAGQWRVSASGRAVRKPVLIIDAAGAIAGVRAATNGDGTERLRREIRRTGLSAHAAAQKLGVHDRTLRRMLSGETPIAGDDPIIERAKRL